MPHEKEITIKTNFNQKLHCDRFIHIQVPWANGIPASAIRLKTADQSHQPVTVKIFDSIKQRLADLSAAFIYLSHGMDPEQFREMLHKEAPAINDDTELAVYFYKKINA